jgi:predicted acetyltransferase
VDLDLVDEHCGAKPTRDLLRSITPYPAEMLHTEYGAEMALPIRPIGIEEFERFAACDAAAGGYVHDPAELQLERALFEPDRSLAVCDGDRIVGTLGTFSFKMSVPAGEIPTAGTTWVSVYPTHRRRGLLTALMRRHLTDVHERGEPLAALWASESVIYGRFGYGAAAMSMRVEIQRTGALAPGSPLPPGTIRLIDREAAAAECAPVYERVRATRPGMMTRTPAWWAEAVLSDLESARKDGSEKLVAVHDSGSGTDGYVIYRIAPGWDRGLPQGTVKVGELVASTPDAAADLWRYCIETDLCTSVQARLRPVDDPLPFLLADPRRARRDLSDGLWVRVVDVAAALAGRGYASTDQLVLQVTDAFCPWNDGPWRLDATPGGASCQRTDADPDVVLTAGALGAAYLGGVGVAQLAEAGLVQAPGKDAITRLDALLRVPLAPWPIEVF